MNSSFLTTLTRALPSVGRPSQLRISPIKSLRLFSSTPAAHDIEAARDLERQILGTLKPKAATDASKSALDDLFGSTGAGRSPQGTSMQYQRMADSFSMESDMLTQPYADRSPPYHLHVYAHKHNTILTLTRPNGNPMLSLSCGYLGFRKGGRAGFDPAFQLASHFFAQMQERGYMAEIKRMELIFRDFGLGREAFTKVLLGNEGKNIRGTICRVTDSTRIKFGGTRSRHERRLG
ncbi:mitochondrial 37S ribosomal protein uS11m [Aspergillus saccharolyticus JOP 1030-1]|uniref:Putative 37S ribosomal protein S11 n=1 Tax=Aspergillus saccharolyticus JOP 1030-1 TaxID=1450539 RepID=A0A318ZGS3_9EURO|nr:putative 37S ribosomal protein S11 [Aspergillus saccharolyticus JOP 1030-1]PYH46185.1 putative 37S ribosomal protein S11 [Aspergillus saccharolyticus JOP 1030-1]